MKAWDLCRACGVRPLPPYSQQGLCLVCELQRAATPTHRQQLQEGQRT